MTSPGATSLKRSSTARVAHGKAPTWTGMWSACAISRDFTSQIASEKSRLELRICEYDVRSMASPISATIALSRCWTTARVMGSTDADMSDILGLIHWPATASNLLLARRLDGPGVAVSDHPVVSEGGH